MAKREELWSRIYAGDHWPRMQHARMDRFHVLRKLDRKYLPAELEEVGQMALGMID